MEWRLILRSALFRVSALVCWILAVLLVHGVIAVQSSTLLALADPGELTSEAIELQIALFAPTMIAFVSAFSASRERRPGIPETLFTTPPSSEEFVLGKFAAVLAASFSILAGTACAAWLWLVYVEGIPTSGLPFSLLVSWWWRPLLFVSGLGFAAGLVLPGAVGGAAVVAYLVAVLLATQFISPVFDPFFGYLSTSYFLIGLAMVFITAAFYYPERRGAHRGQSIFSVVTGLVLAVAGGVLLVRAVSSYEVPPFHLDPSLRAQAGTRAAPGKRIPPFRVVDTRGSVITPETLHGKPTVLIMMTEAPPPIGLFPPARAMTYAAARAGGQGNHIILLILTRDPAVGARWGRLVSPTVPVVCQYARMREPLYGLAGMLGMDWPKVRLGAVAVIDSRGTYLGWRPLFEIFRPPALMAILSRRAGTSDPVDEPDPAKSLESERKTALYFFRALFAYERKRG